MRKQKIDDPAYLNFTIPTFTDGFFDFLKKCQENEENRLRNSKNEENSEKHAAVNLCFQVTTEQDIITRKEQGTDGYCR